MELHQFRGRLFVTDGWAKGSGAPVGVDRPTDGDIGRAVRRSLTQQRQVPKPLVTTPAAERRQYADWKKFCHRVVGSDSDSYAPEKRLLLMRDDEGLRFSEAPPASIDWIPIAEEDDATVGRALREALDQLAPRWPTVAAAGIALLEDQLLVFPMRSVYLEPPIASVSSENASRDLVISVLHALDGSEQLTKRQPGDGPGPFSRELTRIGVTQQSFDAAPTVLVHRLSDGTVRATANQIETTVADGDRDALEAALVRLLSATRLRGHQGVRLFGPKNGWIAVATSSLPQVVSALQLSDAEPTGLSEGLASAEDDEIFVVGPIDGWVLAVGVSLLTAPPDIEHLSARLKTTVQYFATHRVVESHQWAIADKGVLRRSFRYVGEDGTHEHVGSPTEPELSIGISKPDFAPTENDVFAIASGWSIDPTAVPPAVAPTNGWRGAWPTARRDSSP